MALIGWPILNKNTDYFRTSIIFKVCNLIAKKVKKTVLTTTDNSESEYDFFDLIYK